MDRDRRTHLPRARHFALVDGPHQPELRGHAPASAISIRRPPGQRLCMTQRSPARGCALLPHARGDELESLLYEARRSIQADIKEGVEAESFIRLHVVQAVGNERGNYEMRIEPQHVDGEYEAPGRAGGCAGEDGEKKP